MDNKYRPFIEEMKQDEERPANSDEEMLSG